ncbi:hypothetical protein HIM_10889 [Hirsutella minnesotensis 3608]|uniref:Uncharacterized protein n=1 Tax=Hirsutella minnesotensis 3608 TaxID=1043627 RepID=A0A0F7ZJK8_9HYPO|nr:hypothetical protein HIM_10889 [Hirsutella minnesotensis 3608]
MLKHLLLAALFTLGSVVASPVANPENVEIEARDLDMNHGGEIFARDDSESQIFARDESEAELIARDDAEGDLVARDGRATTITTTTDTITDTTDIATATMATIITTTDTITDTTDIATATMATVTDIVTVATTKGNA